MLLLTRCLVTLLSIVAMLCQALAFQNPSPAKQQDPTLKLKADLVEIRAVVTDKSGKLIDNLSKEDFELLENDVPQQINFFSLETIGEKTVTSNPYKSDHPVEAVPRTKPTPTRTIVLFVDTLHLSIGSAHLVKQALKRFVNQQMTDQDLVCLVTSNGSLGLAEQFTQNRQLLRYGIERIQARVSSQSSHFTPYLASMVLRDDATAWQTAYQIMVAEGKTFPNNRCISPSPVDECSIRATAREILALTSINRKRALSTLKYVTDHLADLPGQRIITLFSDGFSLMEEQGAMNTTDLQTVVTHATRSGVVIYSVDAKGLETSSFIGDASFAAGIISPGFASYMSMSRAEMQNGLNAVANDTGGRFIFNTNDLSSSVKKVLEENRVYYALAYYPNTDKELNKFRRITVKVKGHPEYSVRAQKGYLPAELLKREKEEIATTPRQQLINAITAPLPRTNLGVAASADYLENDTDDSQVWVQVYIDGEGFDYQQQNGRFAFNFEVATLIFDKLGKMVSSTVDTIEGKLLPQRLSIVKQNGLRQVKRVSLKPGVYQIRVGVRDSSSEKIGTATAWVEVPDLRKNKLAMSSIFLSESAKERAPIAKPTEQTANPTKAAPTQEQEFFLAKVIQGIPIFKSGHLLAYCFTVYNSASKSAVTADLVMQSEIVQDEKVIFKSDWQPLTGRIIKQGKKGLELGGLIELGLHPGIYEIRISVKDLKSKKTLQQTSIIGVES